LCLAESWTRASEEHHTPGARVYPVTVQRAKDEVRLLREKSGAWGATKYGTGVWFSLVLVWGWLAGGCQ
jgi:hypothetical protein